MKTITIDILNNEAIKRLQDLENLNMIRVHKQNVNNKTALDWKNKYKGAMTQETLSNVNKQLNDLRSEWE